MLWLWCRPAAAALIWPLTWELSFAADAAIKREKTNNPSTKKIKKPVGSNPSVGSVGVQQEMPDLSRICSLYLSSLQFQILNPLSKARDQICVLMHISWVRYCRATKQTSEFLCFTLEAEFLLFKETVSLRLLSPSTDWMWPTHIMEDNLLSLMSANCRQIISAKRLRSD